ncbi:MAG: hypothetical protein FJ009_15090 [Chloroflexi bacterium]|nr:hypothetical protein [Chloroflexota bacterium]
MTFRITYRLILILGLLIVLGASSVLAGAPTGTSPDNPLPVTGAWQVIEPKARAWFYFDYTGDKTDLGEKARIDICLDTHGEDKIELAIYTPAQAREWLKDGFANPIGRGSKRAKPSVGNQPILYDLVWQGSFNFSGRFFAVLTNNNPTPIPFRLTITGRNVTLAPAPTPSPEPALRNPFATPVPTGAIQGRLVFQESSGGTIYTVNGDGSNLKRVTSGLDPAWSPDGTQIAFTRWKEPAGLFIANADGSNEQRIFGAPQMLSPRWSPDGKRIAFTRQSGGMMEKTEMCEEDFCYTFPADPYWKLGVIEIEKIEDGVTKRPLTEPGCTNHCFAPTWSRDNYTLAYADAGFGVMSTDTRSGFLKKESDDKRVDRRPRILFNRDPRVQSPVWSSDGSKIVFQVRQDEGWHILVMNADGSNVKAVTEVDIAAFHSSNNVAPTWSPDGQKILFLSDRNGKWEFFLANVDGSNLQQVLKNVTDAVTIRYNFSNERVIDWLP